MSTRKDHHITSHFDLSTLKLTTTKTLLDNHTLKTLLSSMGLIDGIIEKENHKSVYVIFRYRDSALKAQRAIEDEEIEELKGYRVKVTSTTKA